MRNYYPKYEYRRPVITLTMKVILITCWVIFLLQQLPNHPFPGISFFEFIEGYFALNSNMVNHLYIYQLISYGFLHADFGHIAMNMIMLWMFSNDIEELWGRKNYLILFFFSIFMGGFLVWLVHNLGLHQGPTIGASGAVYGVMITYALLWPNREVLFFFLFPIKIKYLVLVILLPLAILQVGDKISHFCHIGGGLGGLLFYIAKVKYRMTFNFSWSYYMQRQRMRRFQVEMEKRQNVKERVDEILDKIAKNGMNSLSRKEKNFLKEASSKYYTEE